MCKQAKQTGLDFVLAGRTDSLVQSAAAKLDVPYRVFNVSDSELLNSSLDGISVLLNCAGPFARTAKPLIEACLWTGVHYLDTSVELGTYLLAEKYDSQAKAANVMLMPGCGGSVAIFGCLVARALENLDNVQQVHLALGRSGTPSSLHRQPGPGRAGGCRGAGSRCCGSGGHQRRAAPRSVG